MEKIKTILDREQLSTAEIRSNQNFGKVLKEVKLGKSPFYKSPWFYGTAGLAAIAGVVGVTVFTITEDLDAPLKNTKSQTQIVEIQNHSLDISPETILIADARPVDKNDEVPVSEPIVDRVVTPTIVEEDKGSSTSNDLTVVKAISDQDKPVKEDQTPIVRRDATSYGYVMGHYPSIANVQRGTIGIESLCSNSRIESNGVVITSYSIQYYDGHSNVEQNVKGNEIPAEICKAIEAYNLKSYIFFTNIRGVSERGEEVLLTNFSLIPTK